MRKKKETTNMIRKITKKELDEDRDGEIKRDRRNKKKVSRLEKRKKKENCDCVLKENGKQMKEDRDIERKIEIEETMKVRQTMRKEKEKKEMNEYG